MNERELLESAARTVGRRFNDYEPGADYGLGWCGQDGNDWWNPRLNSDQALDLAAALELEIYIMGGLGEVWCEDAYGIHRSQILVTDDRAQDYRDAIVQCAALIGAEK